MPVQLEDKCSPFALNKPEKAPVPVTPVQSGWAAPEECCSQSLFPRLPCKAHSTRAGAQMQISPNICPFCTLICSRKDLCKKVLCPAQFMAVRFQGSQGVTACAGPGFPALLRGKILPSSPQPCPAKAHIEGHTRCALPVSSGFPLFNSPLAAESDKLYASHSCPSKRFLISVG